MVIFTESKAHFACAAVTSRMIDTTLMAGVMSSNAFIMILEKSKKEKNSKGAAVNFIAAIVTQIQTARNNHCKEKYLNLNSSCNPLKIILQLFFATAQKDSSEEACSRLPVCGHDTTERNKEGGLERPRLLPYSLCVPIMACLLTPGTDYTRCAR